METAASVSNPNAGSQGVSGASSTRTCSECRASSSHTRGLHMVHNSGSFFFCSKRCKSRFLQHNKQDNPDFYNRNIVGLLDASLVISTAAADEAVQCNWLDLPENVVWGVTGFLELWDILALASTCRKWLRAVALAPGRHHIHTEVPEDLSQWSRTFHLLPHLQPHLTSMHITIPPDVNSNSSIQIISRCTQLLHLTLDVEYSYSIRYCPRDSRTWLPALSRMSNLQSLKLLAPHGVTLFPGCLSSLTQLTRLHFQCKDSGHIVSKDADLHGEISNLSTLPLLLDLTAPDDMLRTPFVSRLTTLTALAVLNLDVKSHMEPGAPDMHFARLTHLQRLQIATLQPRYVFEQPLDVHTAAGWLHRLHDCLLHQASDLDLSISPITNLPITPRVMEHLAALTQLTSLHVAFSLSYDLTDSHALKPLRRLKNLRSLHVAPCDISLDIDLLVKVDTESINWICWELTRLTDLVLAVGPCCFVGTWECFKYLVKLERLRTLELGQLPERTAGRRVCAQKDEEFPLEYLPSGLERFVWYGREVELTGRP